MHQLDKWQATLVLSCISLATFKASGISLTEAYARFVLAA
ncbi:MAG: hypothetical protein FD135_5174 [Comamonadaceae bacterium]|nr:MAG: hypothetical protein FD135_5174 [Comamonadaceae bacterium]